MNLNKRQLFPKVAWFLVFCPAQFSVYSYYILMGCIYDKIHTWTAQLCRRKWRMIILVNFPIQAVGKKKSEKIRASTGFERVTSAIPVRCSTNWAMKPHIRSEANLLSSYLPWGVKWCEVSDMKQFIFVLRLWMTVKNDHRGKFSNLGN